MLTWHIANPSEFIPVSEMFQSSEIGKGTDVADIQRRITIPLVLGQLITFSENQKLCGFATFALLNENSEKNLKTIGIQPSDWRSGNNFWVVDFVAIKNGYQQMRMAARDLKLKSCKYFRHKHQKVRGLCFA